MFKKLLTNLPFHPSLLGEVAFYVHRLRQETVLRRAGLLLVALTLVIQMFAVFAPSKPSLATSANDIIYGAGSKDAILRAYQNNRDSIGHTDIRAIYSHYGIGEKEIKGASKVTIGSKDKKYISTGRGTSPGVDTFVSIKGAANGGIYERLLSSWDRINPENYYEAYTGISSYGFRFWLVKNCGNIVFEEGTRKPELEIVKTRLTSTNAAPGDTVKYQIQFRNSGAATARNVAITDRLAAEFSYVSYQSSVDLTLSRSGQNLSWKVANKDSQLGSSTRWHSITITLKAKTPSAATARVCNAGTIDASNGAAATTKNSLSARCVTIETPRCPGTGLPIPAGGVSKCVTTCPDGSQLPYNQACKIPQLSCQKLEIIGEPAWNKRKLQVAILAQPGASAKQIDYYVDGKKVSSQAVATGASTQVYEYTFSKAGTYKIKAELIAKVGTVQQSQGCEISETIEPPTPETPRLSTDKAVSNLTQKIGDANNTTAKPGDVLRYTISVANSGTAAATITMTGEYGESIADILEYADLTDKKDATFDDRSGFLSWGAVTIKPGETVEKTFTVTIKNPLPATPISASNPLSYDFILHNKYGREVNVKLDKPASKVVEQTVTTLPNTGPGTSMTISILAAMIVGYFFFRSRLLTRELEIVHHEYSTGGL